MITRSDVVSQRLSNYSCNMIASYIPQELPMECNEFPYRDSCLYTPSFFELTDNCSGRSFLESNFSTNDEHLSDSLAGNDLPTTDSADFLKEKIKEDKKEGIVHSSTKDSLNSLDFFKEEDLVPFNSSENNNGSPFSFSSPITPTDHLLESESPNPLSHLENISYEQINKEENQEKDENPKSYSDQNSYDTSSLMYGNDDLTIFSKLVNCNEVMKNHKSSQMYQHSSPETSLPQIRTSNITQSTKDLEAPKEKEQEFKDVVPGTEKKQSEITSPLSSLNTNEDAKKNKLTGLQRRALDSIFNIIDRPSRGLVLHISNELSLHHITVKNFFSNGRRRLRRAAARLSDPERTRRENQRRKEKRRLAALAASASATGTDKGSLKSLGDGSCEVSGQREPPVLSPERKALMEKLAVKVQRSVAQRGLKQALLKNENRMPPPNEPMQQKVSYQLTHDMESTLNSHLHSNFNTSPVEPAHTYPLLPAKERELQLDVGDNITSIFQYSDGEQFSSYSSPDHDLLSTCVNQAQNANNIYYNNPEQPYSPTSWEALLNS